MVTDAKPTAQLHELDPHQDDYAVVFVDRLLAMARQAGVSDIHVQPVQEGLELRWRLDGVMNSLGVFAQGELTDVVTRLKVLADLLTYHTDVPQEGRIRTQLGQLETRVSTFPTIHGERVVIRLMPTAVERQHVDELGLPAATQAAISAAMQANSGAVLISGPAGSGKTTTAYACLRDLIARGNHERSVITLEDPVEVEIAGASQTQVNVGSLTMQSAIRSVMRQDPEVIFVGEIRDRESAELVFQAALTGHLVLTTFHAGSCVEAILRLMEMGIEPYLLRSALLSVVNQRLLRQLCQCRVPDDESIDVFGDTVQRHFQHAGCDRCSNSGYQGRLAIAESINVRNTPFAATIESSVDRTRLTTETRAMGILPLRQHATELVRSGQTSFAETIRVLGYAPETFG